MHKRSGKLHLHKLVSQDVDPDDILHSHAYRKVGKKAGPMLPRAKRATHSGEKTVSGYKSSMVGSIAQYHDKTPAKPKESHARKTAQHDEDIVGNRPKSNAADKDKKHGSHSEQRHHFVEPTKRNFYRFG